MADVSMPATHWAARLSILFVLALIVFTGVSSGALLSAVHWATDCGTRITTQIWAPLQNTDGGLPPPPRPVSGCLGR